MSALNTLSDAHAERLAETYKRYLLAPPSTTALYQAHLNLGLLACRAGDLAETRAHLERAAVAGIADLADRASRGTVTGDPIALELPVLLAVAFGDEAARQAAADLSREPWFVEPQWHPDLPVLAAALDAMRLLATSRPLAPGRLDEIAVAARSLRSDDRPFPWIGSLVTGLAAIESKNLGALETALSELARLHERAATEGDWQRLPEGVLALWPLALYRLARERGLRPRVDSPYLPPGLLS